MNKYYIYGAIVVATVLFIFTIYRVGYSNGTTNANAKVQTVYVDKIVHDIQVVTKVEKIKESAIAQIVYKYRTITVPAESQACIGNRLSPEALKFIQDSFRGDSND